MAELTTLRIEKPVVEWLNSIKGFLEYNLGTKFTLNDALITILAEVDILLVQKFGIIHSLDEKEKEKLLNRRAEQFWKPDDKDKPNFKQSIVEDMLLQSTEKLKKIKKGGKNDKK